MCECVVYSGDWVPSLANTNREERIRYLEAELAWREGDVQQASAFYQGQVAEFELQIQHLQEDIARWGWGGGVGGWGSEEKMLYREV